VCLYIYIYIYIERERERERGLLFSVFEFLESNAVLLILGFTMI